MEPEDQNIKSQDDDTTLIIQHDSPQIEQSQSAQPPAPAIEQIAPIESEKPVVTNPTTVSSNGVNIKPPTGFAEALKEYNDDSYKVDNNLNTPTESPVAINLANTNDDITKNKDYYFDTSTDNFDEINKIPTKDELFNPSYPAHPINTLNNNESDQLIAPVAQSSRVYVDQAQVEALPEPSTKRKLFSPKIFIIIGLSCIVLVSLWYFLLLKHVSYKNVSLSNNGSNYTFLFFKDSVKGSVNGKSAIIGNVSSPQGATVFDSSYNGTCLQEYPSFKVISYVTMQNVKYPVCGSSKQVFVVSNFKYNNKWLAAESYSTDLVSPLNVSAALTFINTIQLSK